MLKTKTIRSAFRSYYDKLRSMPRDKDGRIIGSGQTGFFSCHESGPVDKGPTLRLGLPTPLKIFAGTKSGTVKDSRTGDNVPKGLSYQFDTSEECADFLILMLEDFQTFVDTIIKGDGTRYYSTWKNVTVVGNPPYKTEQNTVDIKSRMTVVAGGKTDSEEQTGIAVFGDKDLIEEVKQVAEKYKGKTYRMVG